VGGVSIFAAGGILMIMRDIRVKVRTSVKSELVEEGKDGHFLIAVNEPRKEGRANERVCVLLAKRFGVPSDRIRIIRGKDQSSKTVRIHDDDVPPTSRVRGR
jgi:uncharacterized protein